MAAALVAFVVRLESLFWDTGGQCWYSGLSLGFGVRKFGLGFESCVALNILSNLSESQFSCPQMGIITVIPIPWALMRIR